jgi:hypothetical protein
MKPSPWKQVIVLWSMLIGAICLYGLLLAAAKFYPFYLMAPVVLFLGLVEIASIILHK